jgi:glyoxylase-like metal-dependent hydrolase (beta-lactamase superfamily II)
LRRPRGAIWSGELRFPAAAAFAHAAEVAFWSGPVDVPSAQPHLDAARETIRLFGERLHPFEYDAEILPGLRALAAPGHTPGHSAILLQSQGERLLAADGHLMIHAYHLPFPGLGHVERRGTTFAWLPVTGASTSG